MVPCIAVFLNERVLWSDELLLLGLVSIYSLVLGLPASSPASLNRGHR